MSDDIILLVSRSLSWLLDSTMQGWDTLQLIALLDNRLMNMNVGSAFEFKEQSIEVSTLFVLSSAHRKVALFVLERLLLKLNSDTGS